MNYNLSQKMIKWANANALPTDHEMRVRANDLTAAIADKEPSARRILGAWARARRVWCETTGEPLI